jgi:hypothetical protein
MTPPRCKICNTILEADEIEVGLCDDCQRAMEFEWEPDDAGYTGLDDITLDYPEDHRMEVH